MIPFVYFGENLPKFESWDTYGSRSSLRSSMVGTHRSTWCKSWGTARTGRH